MTVTVLENLICIFIQLEKKIGKLLKSRKNTNSVEAIGLEGLSTIMPISMTVLLDYRFCKAFLSFYLFFSLLSSHYYITYHAT